jgi:hypothetical protein
LKPRVLVLLALLVLPLASCAGETGVPHAPSGPAAPDLDGDILALFPPGAIAAATVDAHSLFGSQALGPQVAQVTEGVLPLGADVGLVPSRDIERVTAAWYTVTGADFVAVVRGHIDAAAIQRTAEAHSASHSGGVVMATPYSGHTLFTVADVGFTVLTPRTALAGTAAGLRLALDRIRDGRVRPELSPSISETLLTKDAAFAFAGEFASSPLAGLQGLPLPGWVSGVKSVRVTGAFRDARLNVTGSATFDDPQRASSAADGMRQVGALINTVALAGAVPELKNLDIAADGASVRFAFGVDEGKLRAMLQLVPQWMGAAAPRAAPTGPH